MAVTIIVAVISSGLLSTIVTGIFTLLAQKKGKANGIEKGVRQILYSSIKEKCHDYIRRGWINDDELKDLLIEHEIYHTDLGGNGYLDEMMSAVKRLPLKVEDKDDE